MINPPVPIEDISDKFEGVINIMIYGTGGTGKSEFGASTGKDGIVLSIGNGELTFSSPGFRKRNPVPPKIAYIREEIDPKTGIFKSPPEAFDKVGDFMEWFIQSDFKVLTVDDATALNQFAKNKSLDMSPNFRKDNVSTSLNKSKKYGFPIMEVDDYQREMNLISWLLADHMPRMNDAGKSFILIAHERLFHKPPDKIGGEKLLYRVTPGFTGQTFPDAVVNMFDFVWYATVLNGTVFRVQTMPSLVIAAKTRWSGVFHEKESMITFPQLMKAMYDGKLIRPEKKETTTNKEKENVTVDK